MAPDEERHRRMAVYAVMMSIRFACFMAIFFVEGWWQLACVAGAVVLPYLAVIRANAPKSSARVAPEPPTARGLPGSPDAE